LVSIPFFYARRIRSKCYCPLWGHTCTIPSRNSVFKERAPLQARRNAGFQQLRINSSLAERNSIFPPETSVVLPFEKGSEEFAPFLAPPHDSCLLVYHSFLLWLKPHPLFRQLVSSECFIISLAFPVRAMIPQSVSGLR